MPTVTETLQLSYLRWAAATQEAEERAIRRNRAYFNGEQGIRLTDRQKEYLGDFGEDAERIALCNVCRRAVEIPLERLALSDVTAEDGESAFAEAASGWLASATAVDPSMREPMTQYDLYEVALRDGVACLVVGWDGEQPTYVKNDLYDGTAGTMRLHYGAEGELAFASKRWTTLDPLRSGASGKVRQTLYFPDRIERYEQDMRQPSGWRLLDPAEIGDPTVTENPQPWVAQDGTPLGIPVIPFWNAGGSELDDVLMPQKGLNKSLADIFTSLDMHGYPMLALKNYQPGIGSDGKPAPLTIGPGQAIRVGADGDVNRIPGADVRPMFEVGVAGMIQLAAIIKGWPVYLFMRGEPPSGESLRVMESSLVNQVKRKQETFGAAWRAAFELGRRMHRAFTGEDLPGEIEFAWTDPQTRDPQAERKALIDTLTAETRLGVSNSEALRQLGYTDSQIAMMQLETQQASTDAADAMLAAMETKAPDAQAQAVQ